MHAFISDLETPFGRGMVAWTRSGVVALEAFVIGKRTRTAEIHFHDIVSGLVHDQPEPAPIPAPLHTKIGRALAGRTANAPVDLTVFPDLRHKVYRAVMDVPYGMVATYGEIALDVGMPRAARAVGTALRHCPIDMLIPCHRIVHAGPRIGSEGVEWKRALLLREGVELE